MPAFKKPVDEAGRVVVTRHPGLVAHLRQIGLVSDDVCVIGHADADAVRGKHVIGVLPLRLAALAASVTEVPLDIPAELRGVELSAEQVARYAGQPVTYVVCDPARRKAINDAAWMDGCVVTVI